MLSSSLVCKVALVVRVALAPLPSPVSRREYAERDRVCVSCRRVRLAVSALSRCVTVDPKSELERFQDVTATRLAVWFHDAIYDATAGDNEEQSAVLFQEYAQEMAMDEAQARQVAEMIIATKRHRTAAHESDTTAPTGTDDVHRMLDLDMMILGSEWDVYEAYSQAIRREYAHLTTDAFCAGRARALRSFLSIPHIFCTRTGHELWEERARANIAKEIGILERSSASE